MKQQIDKNGKKRLISTEYNVKTITKSRKNKTEYLVYWEGYKNPSWQPIENLSNYKELLERVDEFEKSTSKSFFHWSSKKYAADGEKRCAFSAFKIAMSLINNISFFWEIMGHGWYSEKHEADFRLKSIQLNQNNADRLSNNQINGFVHYFNRQANGEIIPINKKLFQQNQLINSESGIGAMSSKTWDTGVYLCTAYNVEGVGHFFVLESEDNQVPYAYDSNKENGRI